MPDCEREFAQVTSRLYAQLESLHTIKFDSVIGASEQAVEVWSRHNECDAEHHGCLKVYLRLCSIVIDMLETSLSMYTSSAQKKDTQEAADRDARGNTFQEQQLRGNCLGVGSQLQRSGDRAGVEEKGIVCIPTIMRFGSYKLDDVESSVLALSLVESKLKTLALIFNQAQQQRGGGDSKQSVEIHGMFRRVLCTLRKVAEENSSIC